MNGNSTISHRVLGFSLQIINSNIVHVFRSDSSKEIKWNNGNILKQPKSRHRRALTMIRNRRSCIEGVEFKSV